MESCVIKKISNSFPLIACLEATEDPSSALDTCAQKLGVSVADVKTCIAGAEGKQVIHDNAVRTGALNPPHQYVYVIVLCVVFMKHMIVSVLLIVDSTIFCSNFYADHGSFLMEFMTTMFRQRFKTTLLPGFVLKFKVPSLLVAVKKPSSLPLQLKLSFITKLSALTARWRSPVVLQPF